MRGICTPGSMRERPSCRCIIPLLPIATPGGSGSFGKKRNERSATRLPFMVRRRGAVAPAPLPQVLKWLLSSAVSKSTSALYASGHLTSS